jgi:integrase
MHAGTILARWARDYTAHTCHTKRSALKAILRAAGSELSLPRERRPRPRGVTALEEEIPRLLKAARAHMRLLILLCWQTALRSGEACRLRIEDWNAEAQTIRVVAKGGRERVIPLPTEISGLIAEAAMLATNAGQTAIGALAGHESSPHALRSQWYRLKKDTGVNIGLRLHDLRRTTATRLYAETKDIRAVQEYLGHDALSSTTHYLAPLGDKKLRELQNLLRFRSEVTQ